MHRRILGLVAVALLAACGGGGEETATCSGDGYTVAYPADWHQERCAYFDREPFEVPEATEFIDVAVLVSREPVQFDVATGDDRFRTVLGFSFGHIDGRRIMEMEAETTGEGLLDRGVRLFQVVVDADGESMIFSTYDLPGLDYERNKKVADEMAHSLELLR